MVLLRSEIGNGYYCECCSHSDKFSEWKLEKEMLSIEEVIDTLLERKWQGEFADELCHLYEKEGKKLYGWEIEVFNKRIYPYLILGDKKILIKEEKDLFPATSKEDLLKEVEKWRGSDDHR